MREKTILFQGDSVTDGNRYKDKSQEWDLNHQMGHSYPYVINALLGSKYPEEGYKFKNRGVSGNRITDLFGRWKEDAINLKPDILSILIGVNDCNSQLMDHTGSSPEKYERVFHMLLDEMKAANENIQFVLCEPFILPVGDVLKNWDSWHNLIVPLQDIVKLTAEKYGAVFVPLQKKFDELSKIKRPEYWIWDGIHPTENGHGVIATEWLKYAKDIL